MARFYLFLLSFPRSLFFSSLLSHNGKCREREKERRAEARFNIFLSQRANDNYRVARTDSDDLQRPWRSDIAVSRRYELCDESGKGGEMRAERAAVPPRKIAH